MPFKKEHLEIMEMRDHERELLSQLDRLEAGEALEKTISFTGLVDGRIISCGGVMASDGNVGILWQIPSIYVKDVTIKYARFIRRWIEDLGFKKLITSCLNDNLHARWMTFLGFKSGAQDGDHIEWSREWA